MLVASMSTDTFTVVLWPVFSTLITGQPARCLGMRKGSCVLTIVIERIFVEHGQKIQGIDRSEWTL